MPDAALDLPTLLSKPTSRGHMGLMLEAGLMESSPEAVAAWLKAQAEAPEERRRDCDEELELALLAQREPLIDLALARLGGHEKPQRELFHRPPQGDGSFEFALRPGCLSTACRAPYSFRGPLMRLLDNAGTASAWLRQAAPQEVDALCTNPAIDESTLGDLLMGDPPWDGLGEDLLRRIYFALANNSRMRQVYDPDTMGLDGWSEFMRGRVGSGAWHRAEIGPPTCGIAVALSLLLASIPARAASMKEPMAVAARWSAPADDEAEAREAERAREIGYLTPLRQMRAQVARAAIANASNWLPRQLLSDDLAIRCGAIGSGSHTLEQAQAAFECDGAAAVAHLTDNESLWAVRRAARAPARAGVGRGQRRSPFSARCGGHPQRGPRLHAPRSPRVVRRRGDRGRRPGSAGDQGPPCAGCRGPWRRGGQGPPGAGRRPALPGHREGQHALGLDLLDKHRRAARCRVASFLNGVPFF